MRTIIICLSLTTIFLVVEKSIAQHFSDDGFYAGMSQNEAMRLIDTMGLRKLGKFKENNSFIVRSRQINGNLLVYEFNFCQNKLVGYRKDILPSTNNLILVLDRLSLKYGKNLKTYTNISMGVAGEERKLSFLWKTVLYRVEITYNIFTSNESLTIRYSVPDNCTK
jgi:hypothetical protein